jgi:hypothetical protein
MPTLPSKESIAVITKASTMLKARDGWMASASFGVRKYGEWLAKFPECRDGVSSLSHEF